MNSPKPSQTLSFLGEASLKRKVDRLVVRLACSYSASSMSLPLRITRPTPKLQIRTGNPKSAHSNPFKAQVYSMELPGAFWARGLHAFQSWGFLAQQAIKSTSEGPCLHGAYLLNTIERIAESNRDHQGPWALNMDLESASSYTYYSHIQNWCTWNRPH